MYNAPKSNELPSTAKLLKSTLLAAVLAAVVLATVVLPAEYGIDPTGAGNLLGLTKMGEIKVSLAKEAAQQKAAAAAVTKPAVAATAQPRPQAETPAAKPAGASAPAMRVDQMVLTLRPNEGKEVKLAMSKGEQVSYFWWTDSGPANFDVHSDSVKHRIDYRSYEKGRKERSEGVLEAEFDGKHGWFWRNRTSRTMTITLEVKGQYSEIRQEV